MSGFWNDTRLALRNVVRAPSLFLASLAILSLGMAAGTCAFSMIQAVLLQPLPYVDPDRLIRIDSQTRGGGQLLPVSFPDFSDWRESLDTFEQLAAFQYRRFNFQWTDGTVERVQGLEVSSNLFSLLGVGVRLGRTFQSPDERSEAQSVAVVSDAFWKRQAEGAGEAGGSIFLDGAEFSIVGVMPPDFKFPENSEIWVPLRRDPMREDRSDRSLRVLGRLREGVTQEQAQAELSAIVMALETSFPQSNQGIGVHLISLKEFYIADERPVLLVLQLMATLVLLIASFNASALLLVRNARREGLLATLAALGAGPSRIVRLLLIESSLVCMASALVGLALASPALSLFLALIPVELPHWLRIELNYGVLAYAVLMGALCCLLSGLLPAWKACRLELSEALKGQGRGFVGGRKGRRVLGLMVSSQVVLATVLLTLALQACTGYLQLRQVDLGFEAANVYTLQATYSDQNSRMPHSSQTWDRLLQGLSSAPRIEAVALSSEFPLFRSTSLSPLQIQAGSEQMDTPWMGRFQVVSSNYFDVLGIPLLAGRLLDDKDRKDSAQVVLINSSFRRAFFPKGEVLGQRVRLADPKESTQWRTIAGIVGDIREYSLSENAQPTVYIPLEQSRTNRSSYRLFIRSRQGSAELLETARLEAARLEGSLVVDQCMGLDQVLLLTYWQQRFFTVLFSTFGVVALLLASGGLSALVSQAVSARRGEMVVRLVFGALPSQILRSSLADGMFPALRGILIGLLAWIPLSRLVDSLLMGLEGDRMTSLVTSIGIFLGSFLLASYLPARKGVQRSPLAGLIR